MSETFSFLRRLTPESKQELNNWQRTFMELSPDARPNFNPVVHLVGKNLMYLFMRKQHEQPVQIPPALREPIRLPMHGIKARTSYKTNSFSTVSLMFGERREFIEQRNALLKENGLQASHFELLLHTATIKTRDVSPQLLAQAVLQLPESFEFAPIEIVEPKIPTLYTH